MILRATDVSDSRITLLELSSLETPWLFHVPASTIQLHSASEGFGACRAADHRTLSEVPTNNFLVHLSETTVHHEVVVQEHARGDES